MCSVKGKISSSFKLVESYIVHVVLNVVNSSDRYGGGVQALLWKSTVILCERKYFKKKEKKKRSNNNDIICDNVRKRKTRKK